MNDTILFIANHLRYKTIKPRYQIAQTNEAHFLFILSFQQFFSKGKNSCRKFLSSRVDISSGQKEPVVTLQVVKQLSIMKHFLPYLVIQTQKVPEYYDWYKHDQLSCHQL